MRVTTRQEIEACVAEINSATENQDMTFWTGNDGCLHATEEPHGVITRCLFRVQCGPGMDADSLAELIENAPAPNENRRA